MFEPLLPATLPPLDYDYGDLEPAISGEIMQLHHSKHHQAYINNLNSALERYQTAQQAGDLQTMIALEPTLRFNGGGHINHSLLWKMLAPISQGGGTPASGALAQEIEQQFGSLQQLIDQMSQISLAIQGSGWGWLAYHQPSQRLLITTCSNQDPVSSQGLIGLLGIDVWEHAYYLQYRNARAEYLKKIWQVVNWSYVSERYQRCIQPQ